MKDAYSPKAIKELLKENEQLKREVETEKQITDNFQQLAVDRLRMYSQSEAENKRVQTLNAELLEALKRTTFELKDLQIVIDLANSAIAKSEGKTW